MLLLNEFDRANATCVGGKSIVVKKNGLRTHSL